MPASPVFSAGARGTKQSLEQNSAAAQLAALGRSWWLQTPGVSAPQAGALSTPLFKVNCGFSPSSKHVSHFPVSMLGNLWNFTLP